MRSILGLVRQSVYIGTVPQRATLKPAKVCGCHWLSTSSGAGSKRSSEGSSGQHRSGNNSLGGNNTNSNSKKNSSSTLKRMTDAVRERAAAAAGLTRGAASGDKVSGDRVKHDRTSKRFTLDLGNNQFARIDYRTIGPQEDKIDMYHSEVPKELRGRGLGKALARGALEQAARENMRVKLTCTYLIDFVNKSTDPKLKSTLISPKHLTSK